MKVVIFIVIVLGIVFGYAMIDEFAKNGGFSSPFGFRDRVEEKSPAPKKSYYSSGTSSNTPDNTETPAPSAPNYIGKVTIYNSREATENSPSLIKIYARPYKGEPINLTGWTIKTRKGTFSIPQGMEVYKSNGFSGDIIIKERSTINIIGNSDPFGTRKNFKTNKCLGYLSKSDDLYPNFYSYCDRPKLEDLDGFTPYCKDYLIKQGRCEMPDYSADFKISTDSACVSYILNYFTYNGCVKRYSNDDNFLSDDWYIHVNKNIVEELHDTISLYDRNGLLIDEHSY